MRRFRLAPAAALLCVLGGLACPGCHPADDGMSREQTEKADRLTKIAKQSGGDWEKLSQEDKDYVKSFVSGDEKGAKMLLLGKAGKLHGSPGGGPNAGPPGGPPNR